MRVLTHRRAVRAKEAEDLGARHAVANFEMYTVLAELKLLLESGTSVEQCLLEGGIGCRQVAVDLHVTR